MRPPTPEECTNRAVVDGRMATWYPQMGGYVGKAWVESAKSEPPGCFDVWVYHDGEFPFHAGENPVELHHCEAEQFIRFGMEVVRFMDPSLKED